MKIIYTESAKPELELFHQHQQKKLEEIIKHSKYVYGDDVIELTASDIREASKHFFVSNYRGTLFPMVRLLLKVYFFLGLLIAAFGLFYDPLLKLYVENPTRGLVIGTGLFLSLLSGAVNYYFRIKQNRKNELYLERTKDD